MTLRAAWLALFFYFIVNSLFANLLNQSFFIRKFIRSIFLYSLVLQSKRDDCATWTDEANGMYKWYVSIAEEGTSARARLNAKLI